MSDLNTVADSIAVDTGRTSGRSRFQIIKAIAAAIRFYRKRSMPQTRTFYDLTFVPDQDVYTMLGWTDTADVNRLPANLLRINNIHVTGNKGSMVPLPPHHMQDLGTNLNTGTPMAWSWEDGKLIVVPIPKVADVARIHMIKDLGDLVVKRVTDNTFEIYANGIQVGEEYTSEWLDSLQDLITHRATFLLFMGPFKNTERATMAAALEGAEWRRIESHEEVQDQIMDAVPWGMD